MPPILTLLPPIPTLASLPSASRVVAPRPNVGRGTGFAWCGVPAAYSCCRSFGGELCYSRTQAGKCKRFLGWTPAGEKSGAGVEGSDEGGGADGSNAGASAASRPCSDSAPSSEKIAPPAALACGASLPTRPSLNSRSPLLLPTQPCRHAPADGILPRELPLTLVDPASSPRPRLLPPSLFNLTWTRFDRPPHTADGWWPSPSQRQHLPAKDLKTEYHRSCAVVGSGGRLRRSGLGRCAQAERRARRLA